MAGRTVSLVEYRSLIGTEVGLSSWIVIDQARINAFALTTLDSQSIHVDPEAAKSSVFGGTIAHGFLTLSLLSAMAQEALPQIESAKTGVNYGINSLRFVAPVRSGKRVRGRFVLVAVSDRSPGVVQATLGVQVEIENEPKPAVVAEWLVLFHV
jgi:acyl dehydratase